MRTMTTGYYVPTASYKSIHEHIAVMYEDDQTLVASCGPSDDEHVAETKEQARVFAASFELLEACEAAFCALSPDYVNYNQKYDRPAFDLLRDAIAKARGES